MSVEKQSRPRPTRLALLLRQRERETPLSTVTVTRERGIQSPVSLSEQVLHSRREDPSPVPSVDPSSLPSFLPSSLLPSCTKRTRRVPRGTDVLPPGDPRPRRPTVSLSRQEGPGTGNEGERRHLDEVGEDDDPRDRRGTDLPRGVSTTTEGREDVRE